MARRRGCGSWWVRTGEGAREAGLPLGEPCPHPAGAHGALMLQPLLLLLQLGHLRDSEAQVWPRGPGVFKVQQGSRGRGGEVVGGHWVIPQMVP